MTDSPDPAMARFMIIQAVRLAGVLLALVGIAILTRRFAVLDGVPDFAGYAFLAVGFVDLVVAPQLLARKWRSPRP